MRILQVAHAYLPGSAGGTEVHVHLLSRELGTRHEVAVLHRVYDPSREENALTEGEHDGVPVYRVVNNFSWSPDADYEFYNPGLEATFARVVDEFRPDVIHFHHLAGGLSVTLPALARERGLPTLLTLHDYWYMCPRSTLWTSDGRLCPGPERGLRCVQCWMNDHYPPVCSAARRVRELGLAVALRRLPTYLHERLFPNTGVSPRSYHTTRLMVRDGYLRGLLNSFQVLVSPSEFLRHRFVEWGVDAQRIVHVPNGVDPTKFEPLRGELPLGERLQAVYIGALAPHKGLDVLVSAFNELADCPVDVRIYGGPGGTHELRAYARRLSAAVHNPHVTFCGRFPNERIGEVLSGADLVIVPSVWYENCPMTVLEALYARRPVLASGIGGLAELVREGETGFTFRAGDSRHLAKRVRELAEDRSLLSSVHQRMTRPPTIQETARRLEELYRGGRAQQGEQA